MSSPDLLKSILASIDTLPPFPVVARKILEISRDDEVNFKDIVNLIKYDEAITSNCLKLCNSSYYGTLVKTFTIDQAVFKLGLKNVQMIALASAKELSDYSRAQKGYGYGAGELWRHSVTTAIISQLLFKRISGQDDSVLFTSALLHDIGKIILNNHVGKGMINLIELAIKEKLSLVEAERSIFGIDHAELGGIIAESWQFPSILCNAIKNHHKSPDKFIPNIVAWTRLSNIVYHIYLSNSVYSHHREIISQVKPSILFQFKLKETDIDKIMFEIPEELKKVEMLFNLAFSPSPQ